MMSRKAFVDDDEGADGQRPDQRTGDRSGEGQVAPLGGDPGRQHPGVAQRDEDAQVGNDDGGAVVVTGAGKDHIGQYYPRRQDGGDDQADGGTAAKGRKGLRVHLRLPAQVGVDGAAKQVGGGGQAGVPGQGLQVFE